MKFGAGIHAPQRINPKDCGDPLTFNVAPPAGKHFYKITSEISRHPLHGLSQSLVQPYKVSR